MLKIILSLIPLLSLCSLEMRHHETSIYSKYGEDGVLAKIFEIIGSGTKYCVELGAGDGTEGCSFLLRQQGWHSLLLDRTHANPHYRLFKEFITVDNVNDLLVTYGVPQKMQLLCIDTGYNDYYLWKALSPLYQPALVVIAFNPSFFSVEDRIVQHRPYFAGDGTSYYGASILALQKLGMVKGYSLIHADTSGHYLFFMRNDIVKEHPEFQDVNDVEKLYPFNEMSKPPYHDPKHRPLLSTDELVQ